MSFLSKKAMRNKFPAGKVPWEKIAGKIRAKMPPEVMLGPAVGEDAALVRIGGEVWAVASDPITFTSKEMGKLSVIVNANDVAVRGATPLYFTAVALISPEQADEEFVHDLLDEIQNACESMGVALIGGHTEVTPGLSHSIIIGTMLGKVAGRPITTGGLRAGDLIGMTKWAGLEGTAILLNEFEHRLRELHGPQIFEETRRILGDNWLSIVPEAMVATANPHVTSLHDITEGGIGEALHEMEAASGLCIEVDPARIPILPATKLLCSDFGMNPFGLIGSGSLLVGCAPEGKEAIEKALEEKGIRFAWIGKTSIGDTTGVMSPISGGETSAVMCPTDVPRFERDEILKAWMLEGIEACVFDMDGTMIDSKYDWAAMREQFGVSSGSIIEHLNNLEGEEKVTKLAELHEIERSASLVAHVKDGAADLLALLKEKGIKTALVTNNSDANAHYLIEKFGLAFDVTLTRDSGLYKPSGAPIAEAVRRLGATPDRTLCVGDSLYDILACRDAGCARVCILYDDKRIYTATSDLHFPDIESFIRYLRIAR
jgi:HAD superfamily hydrolase (TIGR01549 family)